MVPIREVAFFFLFSSLVFGDNTLQGDAQLEDVVHGEVFRKMLGIWAP